jgi:hypothetical protein
MGSGDGDGALAEMCQQFPNAPAETALAELNGWWELSSPMQAAESREADAE